MELIDKYSSLIGKGSEQGIQADKAFDEFFGIDFDNAEASIEPQGLNYAGERSEALSTSYLDYYQMLSLIPDGASFADLGAGYGRANLMCGYLGKDINCLSYEIENERINMGQKAAIELGYASEGFIHADLLDIDFAFPQADYFFLYLPTGDLLEGLVKRLMDVACKKRIHIFVIESHGDLLNRIRHLDWLNETSIRLDTSLPRHKGQIVMFQSKDEDVVIDRRNLMDMKTQMILDFIENGTYIEVDPVTLIYAMSLIQKREDLNWVVRSYIPGEMSPRVWNCKTFGSEVIYFDEGIKVETTDPRRYLHFWGDDQIIGLSKVN